MDRVSSEEFLIRTTCAGCVLIAPLLIAAILGIVLLLR